MDKPELLAPAGNFESLKMAVMAGATAVYFGAKNFNARAKAENFGEDMDKAVAFAHMYGVKAYLTLNTLIEYDQIEDLCKTIQMALSAKVDAFIVQDLGVVNILKNCFPQAVIHASTQMAINNYEGAIQAQKMGITRVVLSRETFLNDIKLIKEKTELEIEYFIQGALCVCFSGNCYLSSCLFGKSGNKGECLQPCRLPYKAFLKDKQIAQGYLLSAKDMNMSARLKELATSGVTSFKIEGRLRRPAYVYEATKVYREILDNNYSTNTDEQLRLKKAFNRGDYCEGYFNGNAGIIDPKIQGHKGIKIGKVISFKKGNKFNIITIKSSTINKGDGLKFILNDQEIATITAMDIKELNGTYQITTTANVKANSDVYLILDKQNEDNALSQIVRLPLSIKLEAYVGKPLKLNYTLTYGINSHVETYIGEVFGDICEKANTISLNYEQAKESLQKLNDTYFYLKSLTLNTDNVFLTKKQLNEIRRKMLENINNYFLTKNEVIFNKNNLKNELENKYKNKPNYTLEITENYNSQADFLVVKPRNFRDYDYSKITHKNAYLYVPSFLPNPDLILIKEILNKYPKLGVYAQNLGAINLSDKVILGAKLNLKNMFAINEILSLCKGVKLIEATPELTETNFNILNENTNIPMIKCSFNNFELMTFVHCPIKTLFNNICTNCKYSDDIKYKMQNGTTLKLNRYKLNNCYFSLTKD